MPSVVFKIINYEVSISNAVPLTAPVSFYDSRITCTGPDREALTIMILSPDVPVVPPNTSKFPPAWSSKAFGEIFTKNRDIHLWVVDALRNEKDVYAVVDSNVNLNRIEYGAKAGWGHF